MSTANVNLGTGTGTAAAAAAAASAAAGDATATAVPFVVVARADDPVDLPVSVPHFYTTRTGGSVKGEDAASGAGACWHFRNSHDTHESAVQSVLATYADAGIADPDRESDAFRNIVRTTSDALWSQQCQILDFSREAADLMALLARNDLTRTVRSGRESASDFALRFGLTFPDLTLRALNMYVVLACASDADAETVDARTDAWFDEIASVTQAPLGAGTRTLIGYRNGFTLLPRRLDEHLLTAVRARPAATAGAGGITYAAAGIDAFESPLATVKLASAYLTTTALRSVVDHVCVATLARCEVAIVLAAQADHARATRAYFHPAGITSAFRAATAAVIDRDAIEHAVDAAVRTLLHCNPGVLGVADAFQQLARPPSEAAVSTDDVQSSMYVAAWSTALTASFAMHGMVGREVDSLLTWRRIRAYAREHKLACVSALELDRERFRAGDAAGGPLSRDNQARRHARLAVAAALVSRELVDVRHFMVHVLVSGFLADGVGAPLGGDVNKARLVDVENAARRMRVGAFVRSRESHETDPALESAKRHALGAWYEENTFAVNWTMKTMHMQNDIEIDAKIAAAVADAKAIDDAQIAATSHQ